MAGEVSLGSFVGLKASALQYLGDRSYSIYLWHWPLVVFYTVRNEIGLIDGIGIIALTIGISHLSYRHIEQRFRYPRARADLRPLGYGLAAIGVCVLASQAVQYSVTAQASPRVGAVDANYPGPAALHASAPVPAGVEPIPALVRLKQDLPLVYRMKCHQDQVHAEPVSCDLGDPQGKTLVVLTGDSHAAQWVPALDKLAAERGWRLVTFTKSACPLSCVAIRLKDAPYLSCAEWRENVMREIRKLRPDVVFTSQQRYSYVDREAMVAGLRSVWSELTRIGARVIVIQDTPWMPFRPGDCLAENPEKCVVSRVEAVPDNILVRAARGMGNAKVIDLTDGICGPSFCKAIVGNMIVWRDQDHLTATYSQALAPYLSRKLGL